MPQLASRSPLESRLADLSMGDLVGPRPDDTLVDLEKVDVEVDDYAAIAVVRAPAPANVLTKTIELLHDAAEDFVSTMRFPREAMEAEEPGTFRFVRNSTPYDRIDIEHDSKAFARIANEQALPKPAAIARAPESKPARSVDLDTAPYVQISAPYERIDIEQDSKPFVRATHEEVSSTKTNKRLAAAVRAWDARAAVRASDAKASAPSTSMSEIISDATGTSGSFEAAWFAEADNLIATEDSAPTTAARKLSVTSVLLAAFTLGIGVGVAFFAI